MATTLKKTRKRVKVQHKTAFQTLSVSLFSKGIREAELEGRHYLVVPMVMITEGVHNGSGGPLLYLEEDLADHPALWDHKPIVVYHPKGTACTPSVLNNRKVGIILNTRWDSVKKKLRAEAWLEKRRMKRVDSRILEALEKGEVMEVSTGLWTDNYHIPGEWNGEKYDQVARNHKPDHLALLPDREGACSVRDGAGLLQLNQNTRRLMKRVSRLEKAMLKKKKVEALIANEQTKFEAKDRKWLMSLNEDQLDLLEPIPINVQNDDGDEDEDEDEKPEKKPAKNKKSSKDKKKELRRNRIKKYLLAEDEELDEDEELRDLLGNEDPDDDDDDDDLPKKKSAKKPAKNRANQNNDDSDVEEEDTDKKDFLKHAPPEFLEMYEFGRKQHLKRRADAIKTIKANERNKFSDKKLAKMSLEDLQALAAMATPPKNPRRVHGDEDDESGPLFLGMGVGDPELNESVDDEAPALSIPTFNQNDFGSSFGAKLKSGLTRKSDDDEDDDE
jgi:hypothetical protein